MANAGSEGVRGPRFLLTAKGWPYLLVPFIPIAIVLDIAHASPSVIFFAAALGIIPTAALMGIATEELAARSGPGIGGLLNVTFGNAPELIIALFALESGLHEVVKASIIGSILGNILLVLGGAMLVGGLGRDRQRFNATAANVQSLMVFLAAAALVMPAVFELVEGSGLPSIGVERVDYGSTVEHLSLAVAIVLIGVYVAGLIFSLKTHRAIFNPPDEQAEETAFGWSARRSILMLAIAGVAVGVMSEVLVGSIAEAALFVAPVLVLASFVLGPAPMPLVFNGFEMAAMLLAVLIANFVTHEGESTWFEGVQLLAVYLIFVLAFGFA